MPAHDRLPPLVGNPLLEAHRRAGRVGRGHPVREELVRHYAYGIPNEEALGAIAAASPAGVVELGAGTGYWARLLHEQGVDIVAYDRWPPPSPDNRFVDNPPWFPVEEGDEHVVARHAHRTLLVVWPTYNEAWAADAVARFHAAGGSTLVFVGEGPGGRSGDRTLHAVLGTAGACLVCRLGVLSEPCLCHIEPLWRLVRRVPVPQWDNADDACEIYQPTTPEPTTRRRWTRVGAVMAGDPSPPGLRRSGGARRRATTRARPARMPSPRDERTTTDGSRGAATLYGPQRALRALRRLWLRIPGARFNGGGGQRRRLQASRRCGPRRRESPSGSGPRRAPGPKPGPARARRGGPRPQRRGAGRRRPSRRR